MFGFFCPGFIGLHGIGGIVATVSFIAILVVALFVLFKDRKKYGQPSDSALNELRLRFARGEITQEEFDRIKTSL
jgi:uncharacterized membrane protein